MSPPPPKGSPEPDFDEKSVLEELSRKPTKEWEVPPQVVHGMKQLISRAAAAERKQATAEKQLEIAEKKLKRRNAWRLVYGLCGMLGIGGGGVGTWNAHGRSGVLEHQVHELEKVRDDVENRLRKARSDIDHCCP